MPEIAETFRALHVPGRPLLMPNAWDAGSARVLASLGFAAVATTSAGHAGTLGRPDGGVSRQEALAHAADLVAAVDLPVSADLEHGFGSDAAGVAATVAAAVEKGLAGCSVEDWDPDSGALYPVDVAAQRVAAAARAADGALVLTARAENFFRGHPDLDDTIARLQAYAEAGADVLYAPGITDPAAMAGLVASVDRPVNALAVAGAPTVAELAAAGVARISVGSQFFHVAMGALVEAATELTDAGVYGYAARATAGRQRVAEAFR